jgi:hypothetical protein
MRSTHSKSRSAGDERRAYEWGKEAGFDFHSAGFTVPEIERLADAIDAASTITSMVGKLPTLVEHYLMYYGTVAMLMCPLAEFEQLYEALTWASPAFGRRVLRNPSEVPDEYEIRRIHG